MPIQGESVMRILHTASALLPSFLLSMVATAAVAAPAPLASGLHELSADYDGGDARLPAHLALHITNRSGDPLVMVRLTPDADADAVLTKLAAAGFSLTTRSTLKQSLLEGYLPLAAVHAAAAVPGVRAIYAQQRPVKHAAPRPVLP